MAVLDTSTALPADWQRARQTHHARGRLVRLVLCTGAASAVAACQELPSSKEPTSLEAHADPLRRKWFFGGGVAALGGTELRSGPVLGGELRVGTYRRLGLDDDGAVGDVVGFDARMRWWRALSGPSRSDDRFMLGIAPWIAQREDYLFHVYDSRQPTLVGVLVPEGGLLLQPNGHGAYLRWSAMTLWSTERHMIRMSPFLLEDHWHLTIEPAFTLLFEPDGPHTLLTVSLGGLLY
jgi:hypothetical protein